MLLLNKGAKSMEIIPGIHKIDGVRGANCYLVTSGPEMVLIDTGMRGSSRKIADYVKRLGKNPSDIKYVILTHSDIDHVGGAAEIKHLTGAKLVIHKGDAGVLAGKEKGKHVKGLLGLIFKLMAPVMRFRNVQPDIVIKENTDLAGFKIIHTPGHSDGSICLFQPGKVLFAGDALRSDQSGNPRPPSKMLAADIVQAKASVAAIAALEYDTLFVGHGAPVKGNAAARVKELLANWQ
jgi:glyoxylase-like metal-dependent hydrolase (beta-lactamase superfamily II)